MAKRLAIFFLAEMVTKVNACGDQGNTQYAKGGEMIGKKERPSRFADRNDQGNFKY